MAIFSMGLVNSVQGQQQKTTIKHAQDFDEDILQVFNELFEQCPSGIVLYKYNGEMVVVCLIDSTNKIIVNDIDIDIKNNNDGDDNGKDDNGKDKEGPDRSCLFNVYQPKCAPNNDGNCPDGFNMNEDGRCFPDHSEEGCPDGYHGTDDDETGQCYPDDEGCPDGMELRDGNCTYINEEEIPPVEEEQPLPPVVVTTPLEEVTQSEQQQQQEDISTVPIEEGESTTEEDSLSTETESITTDTEEDNSEPETTEEETNN